MGVGCKLVVNAGEHARDLCPVSTILEGDYTDFSAAELTCGDKTIPCQITQQPGGVRLNWLVNGLKPLESRTYKVKFFKTAQLDNEKGVQLHDDSTRRAIDVLIGKELFTSYHYGHEWVRPFLYPVTGPSGVQITRSWPIVEGAVEECKDHPHHKSIWVAYGECGKNKIDHWSEEPGHGWQRHRRFLALQSGPVFGEIEAINDWCAANDKKQFEEIRRLRFYGLPGGTRLFDISLTFRMTEGPVTFHDTKEGGLVSVRVATSMDVQHGGRIENGFGGINEAETWGKQAPWCDYSGLIEGHQVGIAILDHDLNPRYPTGWHVRDYGLMTANCFAWSCYRPEAQVRGDMTFAKGQETTWRYRLYIHKGDASHARVNARFIDFIFPPAVTAG